MELKLSAILSCFFLTLVSGVMILATTKYHGRWTEDNREGVQKFHVAATPRIGGLAIFLA